MSTKTKSGALHLLRTLRYSLTVVVRPFYGYGELKYEHAGSLGAAFLLLLLALFTRVFNLQYTGFLFSEFNPFEFNVLRELTDILIPFLLFVVANWMVSTIFDGEGTMREIFQFSCYALTPYIIITIPATLLTRVVTAEEGVFITYILGFALLWSGVLLFCGNMTVHQFSPLKTVVLLVVTVAAMLLIIFVAILFASITDKLVDYIQSIYMEVRLRL